MLLSLTSNVSDDALSALRVSRRELRGFSQRLLPTMLSGKTGRCSYDELHEPRRAKKKAMRNIVWPYSLNLHYFPSSCDFHFKCFRRLRAVLSPRLNNQREAFIGDILMVPGRHTVYCEQRVTMWGRLTKARGHKKRKAEVGSLPGGRTRLSTAPQGLDFST